VARWYRGRAKGPPPRREAAARGRGSRTRSPRDVEDKSLEDARNEGRNEGRNETRSEILHKLLALKFGELSPEAAAQIANATPEQLDRYLERVLFADSLAAVFA